MFGGKTAFDLSSAENRALLKPVSAAYDKMHAAAYPEGKPKDDELRGVEEREAVGLRAARGFLTGLRPKLMSLGVAGDSEPLYAEERGLLASMLVGPTPYAARHLCLECHKALKKKKLPIRALVAGTWQGLVPPELAELSDIELQMLGIYNVIQFIKPLASGTH